MTGAAGPADTAPLPHDARVKRARWRACHRGTKEMDILLGRFAEVRLAGMSPADLSAFEELLALPDPDLNRWIFNPSEPAEGALAAQIAEIRRFHDL